MSSEALPSGAVSPGWVIRYARSSVGAKHLMALTGMALLLFVVQHMVANLAVFAGPDDLNAYAAWIKSKPLLLWGGRAGLSVVAVTHVLVGLRLAWLNREARPVDYAKQRWSATTPFARTMAWSGLLILWFVLFHLAHLTLGTVHPSDFHHTDAEGRHDVYTMFVLGFQRAPTALAYCAAMLMLGFHLSHGVRSMFQSLGLHHPRYTRMLDIVGPTVAWLLVLGNISMPLAVLTGLIRLSPGVM